MAPRRLLMVGIAEDRKAQLVERLLAAFETVAPVRLAPVTLQRLGPLLDEAAAAGARVCGSIVDGSMRPILVADGSPAIAIAQEDLFAPVLTLIDVPDAATVVAAQQQNPFGLTASLFGDEAACRVLADRLEVGSVFINDVIVPSADPRTPFGGRRLSGFGVTQGVEGLLEMTAVKTVAVRRGFGTRHLEPTTPAHADFFKGFLCATYAGRWTDRWRGIKDTVRAARRLE